MWIGRSRGRVGSGQLFELLGGCFAVPWCSWRCEGPTQHLFPKEVALPGKRVDLWLGDIEEELLEQEITVTIVGLDIVDGAGELECPRAIG